MTRTSYVIILMAMFAPSVFMPDIQDYKTIHSYTRVHMNIMAQGKRRFDGYSSVNLLIWEGCNSPSLLTVATDRLEGFPLR